MPAYASLRKYLTFAVLLLSIFQVLSIGICVSEEGEFNAERQKLDLVEKDVLVIYLSPQVENLSVRCQPLRHSGAFDLSISTKYLDPYLKRKVSAVWVQPAESGIYNLTVNFVSNSSWEYMLRVYTRSFEFYKEYYGKRIGVDNFFTELQPPLTRHPGNWTINIMLVSHSLSPSFSPITLPTPVNSAILIAAVGLISYIDSFILLDTYFKSKKEIVSHTRWILVGIALLISAYAAYQIYNFTTFTLPEGG